MTDLPVEITCPLGSQCEEIRDNKIYRCAWYTTLKGMDSNGQDRDEKACAITWMPVLQIESAGVGKGQVAAIESLRNEHIKRQDQALQLIEVKDGIA